MPIDPGQPLTFSEENRRRLGGELRGIVEDLEQQHHELLSNISTWWSWYEAEPLTKNRTTPWAGASNVVVPVIRIHADATIARFFNLMKATDKIWMGRSQNEQFTNAGFAKSIPDFLNWSARNEYDFFGPIMDWITEVVVIGSGVFMLSWEEKTKTVFVPGQGRGKAKLQTALLKRGPILRHIPRERALWDPNWNAAEAPVFVRQVFMTWADIVRRVATDGWDSESVRLIKSQTIAGSSSATVTAHADKLERGGIDFRPDHKQFGLFDIREIWIDWPVASSLDINPPDEMDPDRPQDLTTLVVILHADSGRVLHVAAHPFLIPDKPFYDAYFRKRTGQSTSPGLARLLRDIQAARTAQVNQAIDVVTLSNSVSGVTNDPKLANREFTLSRFLLTDDTAGFSPLNLSKLITPDLSLGISLDAMGERLTGVSDPTLGRETRLGGHPSPATSTLALLQQARQRDVLTLRSIRRAISQFGLDKASVYQQMETDPTKIIRVMGEGDAPQTLAWIFPQDQPIIGNLELDLAAVTETLNPDTEQQRAVLTFQITANYYSLVVQYLQIVANPQVPPEIRAAAQKGLQAFREGYERILENNNVDDIENFSFNLQRAVENIRASSGGDPAQGQGVPQGGAVAGPGNGAGGPPQGSLAPANPGQGGLGLG